MPDTTLPERPAPPCPCRFVNGRTAHHDELMRAPTEVGVAVALLELATSWCEIDYSGEALIPPADWLSFAADHDWHNPDLAQRLFGVAVDIARRSIALSRC